MQIIGKVLIQGKEKQILLKEEDEFFKYYSLELIGAYSSKIGEQKIILKNNLSISEKNKIEIIDLVNKKVNKDLLQKKEILQVIGKAEINGKIKEILLKMEDLIGKYFYLDLIGIYTPKMPWANIIFRQDTLENKLSAEIKDNEQKNKISPTEKEQIEQFLERIKIKDIMQKIKTQEKLIGQKTKYNKSIKENEIKNKQIQNNQKQQTLNQLQKQPKKIENTIKDINIKQEVDMNTRVTDMSNLEQVLKKNNKMPKLEHGDEPLKMGIVESDDLKNLRNEKGEKEQGHTSRFETVIITKKGKVQALDLDNDTQEGTNPLERNYQVKQNGEVKKSDVLTRLKLGEGSIGIEKGKYGEIEVYHSPRKTIGGKNLEGNKSLDRQLETKNAKNSVKGTDIETLKLAQEYNDGYRSVEEGYQEIQKHEKNHPNCDLKEAKDLDGNDNTKSHTHEAEEYVELSSGEKVTYKELATRWGFYKDGKPDSSFVKGKFQNKAQDDKKPEEVIAELDEEYEDPRAPQRGRR